MSRTPRNTLSGPAIINAAISIADADGLEALTMRSLAVALGVKPMSLYTHVPTKVALLSAMIDTVFEQTVVPDPTGEWRSELASRSRSLYVALTEHPWAIRVIESSPSPGSQTLDAHEAVLETLARAGFPLDARAHAFAMLDAFVFGFSLQAVMLKENGVDDRPAEVAARMGLSRYARIAEVAALFEGDRRFTDFFEQGLELVLDGIARLLPNVPVDARVSKNIR